MVGSFPGRCPRAASGHAAAAPPSSDMNSRDCSFDHLVGAGEQHGRDFEAKGLRGYPRRCARVSWLFIRTQIFDPQSSLRNVHVEALRIILDRTLCGSPYTTRINMENPHANCFG